MTALLAFVRLTRPLFLVGGFVGVALGAAVAAWSGRALDAATYLWAQGLVTAFQLMVHYANDYFDRDGDARAERTPWSGGSGVLVTGALDARTALIAAVVCALLGLGVTLRFALTGNIAVAWIGVAIFALAWSYSGPPLRLATRGAGEVDTVVVVALLVPAAGFAAFSGGIDLTIARAVIAPAAAMLAMMLCVELPDADADRAAAKRTLVVRYGAAACRGLAAAFTVVGVGWAAVVAVRISAGYAALVLLPACVAGLALLRQLTFAPRPVAAAFWGVASYALTTGGLAAAYGLAAAAR